VLNALPSSHSTPELNVACAEGEPHQVTRALQAQAAQAFAPPARVSDIDGLRVDWPDGFGLIRASNTTPVLVLRFEGQTEAALHRIETEMLALLRSSALRFNVRQMLAQIPNLGKKHLREFVRPRPATVMFGAKCRCHFFQLAFGQCAFVFSAFAFPGTRHSAHL
jgi:hypothetical protein